VSWKDDWIEKAREHKRAGEILYEKKLYRDSISRLYYSAFSLMVAVCGKAPKGKWEHKGILKPFQKWLHEMGNPLSDEELELLKEFYERRREADYETNVGFLKEEIEDYIKLINRLLGVVDDS
jgi:uncharacterized protein (UPF0332 family)